RQSPASFSLTCSTCRKPESTSRRAAGASRSSTSTAGASTRSWRAAACAAGVVHWHDSEHRRPRIQAERLPRFLRSTMIDVVRTQDIVLPEIAADLHLDELERHLSGVLQPVPLGRNDVDALVLADELLLLADGHFRGAVHDDPVLGAVVM